MANRNAALTPPDTPTPPAISNQQSKADSTIAAELVRLAAIIDKLVNTNDFDFTSLESQELLSHIAADFACQIDCIRHPEEVLSWEELVSAWRKGAEDDPGVKLAWTSVSTTVDETKGDAQLYLEKEITAVGGLKFHVMEEQLWRRDDSGGPRHGTWFLMRMLGMRGTPANSGFDSGNVNPSVPGTVEPMRDRPFTDDPLRQTSVIKSNNRNR